MASEIKVDTISEKTSAGGVTIDSVKLKDGGIVVSDAANIGSASDTDAIAIASNGVVTFSQNPVFPDGGVAVADLDIDGATDIGAAIVDADLFIVDDGAGGTNRKTAASRLKTYIGGGITTASQWRLTTSATGDLEPIASNWEVNDTTGYGSLGSAMSESSGVFTFPSTGFWLITFICTWYLNGSSKWVEADIRTTTNNSSYTNASETYSHITQSESDTTYTTATAQTIFDVTNTSNCKVQFRSRVNNNSTTTYGSSSLNATGVTFVRLGDT